MCLFESEILFCCSEAGSELLCPLLNDYSADCVVDFKHKGPSAEVLLHSVACVHPQAAGPWC